MFSWSVTEKTATNGLWIEVYRSSPGRASFFWLHAKFLQASPANSLRWRDDQISVLDRGKLLPQSILPRLEKDWREAIFQCLESIYPRAQPTFMTVENSPEPLQTESFRPPQGEGLWRQRKPSQQSWHINVSLTKGVSQQPTWQREPWWNWIWRTD